MKEDWGDDSTEKMIFLSFAMDALVADALTADALADALAADALASICVDGRAKNEGDC